MRRIALSAGIEVTRSRALTSHAGRRQRIMETRGIDLVLDVGANVGDYGQELRDHGYRGRIVSFEPQASPFGELERRARSDDAWDCKQLALGSSNGAATIHVAKLDTCSSFLELEPHIHESSPDWRFVRVESVQVERLDSALARVMGATENAWLKLDVQGYELEILRAAPEALAQIDAMEVELLLEPLYENQSNLPEVVAFLSAAGFALVSTDTGYVHPASGETMYLDGIFVRRP